MNVVGSLKDVRDIQEQTTMRVTERISELTAAMKDGRGQEETMIERRMGQRVANFLRRKKMTEQFMISDSSTKTPPS